MIVEYIIEKVRIAISLYDLTWSISWRNKFLPVVLNTQLARAYSMHVTYGWHSFLHKNIQIVTMESAWPHRLRIHVQLGLAACDYNLCKYVFIFLQSLSIIAVNEKETCVNGLMPENQKKNRYNNSILPCKYTCLFHTFVIKFLIK